MNPRLEVPSSLKSEHEELHSILVGATHEAGELGAAATALDKVMRQHVAREEQFALPPIALLPRLARGEAAADMEVALTLTDRLQAELPEMLSEHQEIIRAVRKLLVAARNQDKVEYAEFAERLLRHIRLEEDVLYPAAVLAGRYLRLRLGRSEG
jgi:hemerythrin-like domain-containing protein